MESLATGDVAALSPRAIRFEEMVDSSTAGDVGEEQWLDEEGDATLRAEADECEAHHSCDPDGDGSVPAAWGRRGGLRPRARRSPTPTSGADPRSRVGVWDLREGALRRSRLGEDVCDQGEEAWGRLVGEGVSLLSTNRARGPAARRGYGATAWVGTARGQIKRGRGQARSDHDGCGGSR